MARISQQQLESYLWGAATLLRGTIDAGDYKQFHIRSLLASVSLSYPIGAVMLLETGGEGVRFRPRPLEGATVPANTRPERLILDGQQRLTSLFLTLKSGKAVKTKTEKNEPIERVYYLDIAKCLDEAVDRMEAVVSLPTRRKAHLRLRA